MAAPAATGGDGVRFRLGQFTHAWGRASAPQSRPVQRLFAAGGGLEDWQARLGNFPPRRHAESRLPDCLEKRGCERGRDVRLPKFKAYDLKTGAERWSLAGMPSFTCTTPVVGDGLLFFAGWSGGKSDAPLPPFEELAAKFDKNKDGAITPEEVKGTPIEASFRAKDIDGDGRITAEDIDSMKARMAKGENLLVAIRPGGRGELSESKVAWKQTRGLPLVPSALYYRGQIYLVKEGGMVSCYDAKTGRAAYQQERLNAPGNYYASPIAADGRVIVASLDGKVTVFAAGGDTPKVLYQSDFKERIAATPALVQNQLYLRTATALYAFGK